MQRPKLILDTSACSRIARSPRREAIEAHLDAGFRRVVSVQTFWELLQQIEGGDGRHFSDDKEVLKVAAGAGRLSILPNPLSFAVEVVLKFSRPAVPLPPAELRKVFATIMKARTRDELYSGVKVIRGVRQVRQFDPAIVRQQQDAGEQAHVERLQWAKRKNVSSLPADAWARAMIQNNLGERLTDEQAKELGARLDAAYQFDMQVWKAATTPKTTYKPENHRNDWTDMQQLIYLCDPSIHLLTADKGICRKVAASHQKDRVFYLPDHLSQNGLTL